MLTKFTAVLVKYCFCELTKDSPGIIIDIEAP